MFYLRERKDIEEAIALLSSAQILWVDTEVADYKTRQPRLSLIQVSDDAEDLTGDKVYILDVIDSPEIANIFIEKIMVNEGIEKVFHNAKYDVNFLGKKAAKNITCTWEIAKKLPYYLLPLPNLTLKTLATKFGNFPDISKEEQGSDWGQRPLRDKQLEYAKMDPVYVAKIHGCLLEIVGKNKSEPASEDVSKLTQRYREIENEWKLLDSEKKELQERIKKAMLAQDIVETRACKLSSYERTSKKIAFAKLASLVTSMGLDFDFPVTLTQKLQKELGDVMTELPVEEEKTASWRLTFKPLSDASPEE
ncbi:MAG: ribonuclease D [Cyanobacteriota bacterium]|nr:ribonuclease D [Cyanobacteriota bacterium]